DMTACEILFYGRKDVAFSSYGEYWRQARKICILELLSLKRVQQLHFVREEEVTLCMNKIRNAARSGEPVNLSELLLATPNNIVSRCILGQRVEDENGRSWFGELSRQIMIDLMAFSMGDFYPSLRWVDVLRGFVGRLNSNFRAVDTFLDQIIEERRAATKSDVDGTENVKADFVDILLKVQREEKKLTQDHMKAILLDMFVGGTDTTSASSEWLMTELLRNPRVMKKAQEEVRKVVGNKKKIEMSDINKMDYLKCVIKETFRLHPSAPLLLPRETSKSVKVGGRQIPAKTRVFINAWAIQRDPNVWERPEEFIPERFENKTVDFNFDLLVFGCGRRKCPGLTFGMVNIEYIAANILFWFDWKLSGKPEDLDMSEVYGLSVTKKNALHVVPIPYSP
ncbi:Cytochrome P450, E-class, group I, partial [Trema orientale]